MKHVKFDGRLVVVGFGSIGQGVLPLILRHVDVDPNRITIVTAEDRGREVAAEYGIRFVKEALTRENYRSVLEPLIGPGDFLLNLSVDVSSVALIRLAQERMLSISTPASSLGRVATPTRTSARRSVRIMRFATARWPCGRNFPRVRPRC